MRGLLLILLALCVAGCEPSPTIQVKREYCGDSWTGVTRTGTDVTYICTSFDKNGVCVIQTPIYSDYQEGEVLTTCQFTTWRRK